MRSNLLVMVPICPIATKSSRQMSRVLSFSEFQVAYRVFQLLLRATKLHKARRFLPVHGGDGPVRSTIPVGEEGSVAPCIAYKSPPTTYW